MDENPDPIPLTPAIAAEALSRIGCLHRLARRPGPAAVDPLWSHVGNSYVAPTRTDRPVCRRPPRPAPSLW